MNLGLLEKQELDFLCSSLDMNKGMSDEEYKSLSIKHPYAIMREDNALILSSMIHYGLHDNKLNDFILRRFGNEDYVIDFFYQLVYKVGDYTNPHFDKKIVTQTTLVLLNDDFIGGDLILDSKKVPFNKKGMYINFNGNKQKHEVTKVIGGERRVLVIMFNKKVRVI